MTDAWDRSEETGRYGAGAGTATAQGGRAQRRREGGGSGRSGGHGGHGGDSGRGGRSAGQRPGAVSASVLIGVMLVTALPGSGGGLLFTAGVMLGTAGAALLCSRPGVWWVATGAPPVVLLMALAGHVVSDGSTGTVELAKHLVQWVAGAFPLMGLAVGCAVAIGVGRLVAANKAKGNGRG
ncbi:hypothetical protein ABIA32_005710 [Streptacidiphilus sp. MAP12-20]|uniref:DUF6542 domain-containing protein n=1 Tax=Streptacidiphilus sp. MAP12-20 TaxID=3156299 RepID=UPI003517DE0D